MARTTQTLSVRIDPKKLKELIKYTKDHRGVTQAKVVESLIGYFAKQSSEQQRLIVMGAGSDYLGLLGTALELITWADHANRPISLPWAIELYTQLDTISAEAQGSVSSSESTKDLVGVLSLRRIAWYKMGSAWMDLAMQLRAQALAALAASLKDSGLEANVAKASESKPNEWHEYYAAALESLRVAIAYHRLFNKSREESKQPAQPAVLYNQACAWTLVAQYVTEQNATNPELHPLAQHELQLQEEERQLVNERVLEMCLPPSDLVEATKAISSATACLSKIRTNYRGDTEGMSMADTQWLFDYAERDPDLACLRKGNEAYFDKWLTERKSRTSLLDSYKRLRRDLPAVVEKFIDSDGSDVELTLIGSTR